MRKTALLLATAVCLAVTPSAQQASPRAKVDEAAALLKSQKAHDALTILQAVADDPGTATDPSITALTFLNIGQAHLQLNDYPKALDAYERGRAASRTAGEPSTEAACVIGLALVRKSRGEYAASLALGEEAVRLYEPLNDSEGSGRAWQHVGNLQDLTGHRRDALASYDIARRFYGNSKSQQALRFLNEVGITRKNLGDYQEAAELYKKALDGLTEIGDRYGQASVLNNLGNVYWELGQWELAIGSYQQSLQIARQINERRGESMLLGNLGSMFLIQGDDQRAFEYMQQQLRITRELGNRQEEANALGGLGEVYEHRGEFEQARQNYERSLAIQRELGARSRIGATLSTLAFLAVKTGQTADAQRMASEALEFARTTDSPELEWKAHLALAKAAAAEHRSEAAITELRAGAAIVNNLRANIWSDAGKIGFVDDRQEILIELVSVLVASGKIAEALEAAEAARARAFADLLEQRQVRVKAAEQPAFEDLRVALADVRQHPAPARSDTRGGSDRISPPSAAVDASLAKLRSADGELASLITAESPTRSEIAQLASRLRSTFIEYVVTDRALFGWVVSPDGEIHSATVNRPRSAIDSLAAELKKAVDSSSSLTEPAALRSQLRELHQILIDPLEAWLPSSPDAVVVIVPHGSLATVPFAALEDASGRPLIERHTLAFAPSIAVYRYTPDKRHASPARRSALIVADPEPPSSSGMAALPGAREEGQQIARQLGTTALLLTGSRASEAAIKQEAEKHRILHFATHGLVSAQTPLASSLLLSAGDREDGYLRADEILGLTLNADLVVLSGCSTGLGRLSGDGVVGLSRAFIYAGTPAVIVSQWDVSDRATAYLMNAFYSQILQRRGPAAALRRAQLDTRRRFPNFPLWGAFLVVGEPG